MSESLINSRPAGQPDWLRVVQQKVETLRYGVVQLVVHDGRVTQIERTEKTRIQAPPAQHGDRAAP
jgi:hypothetical protein